MNPVFAETLIRQDEPAPHTEENAFESDAAAIDAMLQKTVLKITESE